MVGVYGPPSRDRRDKFFQNLNTFPFDPDIPLIMGCDFNMTRNASERQNCRGINGDSRRFSQLIADMDFLDLPNFGIEFTWTNNQAVSTLAKLDRILINTRASVLLPNSLVSGLPMKLSNHNALLLSSCPPSTQGGRPFRLENKWLQLPNFQEIIFHDGERKNTFSFPPSISILALRPPCPPIFLFPSLSPKLPPSLHSISLSYLFSISASCTSNTSAVLALLSSPFATGFAILMASGADTAAAMARNQPEAASLPLQSFKYSMRVVLKSIVDREDKGLGLAGQRVVAGGWVKSRKDIPEHEAAPAPAAAATTPPPPQAEAVSCYEVFFHRVPILGPLARILIGKLIPQPANAKDGPFAACLHINDGSCSANLQVVMDSSMSLPAQVVTVGASILVEGVLQKVLTPKRYVVQLKVVKILHVGIVDMKKYPLAKPKFSLEFLRSYPHLRPRSITVGSVTRIRSNIIHASHEFFQKNGFIHVHMPIITSMNTGDQGKMFQVTTLLKRSDLKNKSSATNGREDIDIETVNAAIEEKRKRIDELQRTYSNLEAIFVAELDLQKSEQLALLLEKQQKATTTIVADLDFSKDFFSHPVYLSLSAALHLESYACALSSVYTIGPVFQADEYKPANSLAEKWVVEVELAFAELEDVMNCAEDLLKFLCHSLLENSNEDVKYVLKKKDKQLTERLQSIVSSPFARITYSEALDVLNQVKDRPLQAKVEWGHSLSEEHESYLVNEVFKKPIIVYDYPKEIKPFYVRVRDDGKTASAFDIIAPNAGVLIGGSQKEERIDVITERIQEADLPSEQYEWYLDLRKHGSVKHSGFSLGLEKMIMFATGLTDVKDVIPFPRTHDHASM
ncbi:hypothetical protein Cni_G03209 [Canna indica]|uniref:asparagine--tRNA ligase n=1 Tax=Canna indica TaxID=4628 RepID=A0AAQ3JU53_9LILI|nr:hypothetical protein Cni_G03209 [Canna indica]